MAGRRRQIADPPHAPAERQVPRYSGQPPEGLANVRYRRPPTFACQIRAAAPSLELPVSCWGPTSVRARQLAVPRASDHCCGNCPLPDFGNGHGNRVRHSLPTPCEWARQPPRTKAAAQAGRRALRQLSALVDDGSTLGSQLRQGGLLDFGELGVLAHVQLSGAVWPAFRRRLAGSAACCCAAHQAASSRSAPTSVPASGRPL